MADPSVLRGGYVRVRLTFTKDGEPWNDVANYSPLAQIRDRPRGTVLTTWDITYDADSPNIMILTLPSTKSVLVTEDRSVWDVRFLKPSGEEPVAALRPFYWPGPRSARRTLTASGPVSEPS